ncbi:hypothetical protein V3N99_09510 [Dermatophilaceae bacterium Soc4.6]
MDAFSDDDELVPAEPAHEVVAAQGQGQPPGLGAQHLVGHVMAQGVVHRLEAVQVDEQDRDRGSRTYLTQ